MPKTRYSKKLFPFSPGIPWLIKNNKYVLPSIDAKVWDFALKDKDFIVSCYGGFLESFFSLSYCEAFAKLGLGNSIKWMGNPDFEYLSKAQGLASINSFDLGTDILEKYPVPIFMDKDNNAYFNVLHNYLNRRSYQPNFRTEENKDILLKQIYDNSMLNWDNFIPKVRNVDERKVDVWLKNNKLHKNSRFITVFPQACGSMHELECLDWNDRQVRELSQMLRHLNISVVSFQDKSNDPFYKAGNVIRAPIDFDIILILLSKSMGVLSSDYDFLLVSMMLSENCLIMSRPLSEKYDLYDNSDFISANNVIFTDIDLSPRNVFQVLEAI